MEKSGEEEKIRRILTNPMLSEKTKLILKDPEFSKRVKRISVDQKLLEKIKALLENDHAVDCIMLLYMNRGKWKETSEFMRKNGLSLSDGTFRARMIEIEHLGLANKERIESLKEFYTKTDLGEKVAKLLLEFLTSL